jgi:hypothetical protein
MEVSGQLYAPDALIPEKSLDIIRIRGVVVPRAGLEKRKISSPAGIRTLDRPVRGISAMSTTLARLCFTTH